MAEANPVLDALLKPKQLDLSEIAHAAAPCSEVKRLGPPKQTAQRR